MTPLQDLNFLSSSVFLSPNLHFENLSKQLIALVIWIEIAKVLKKSQLQEILHYLRFKNFLYFLVCFSNACFTMYLAASFYFYEYNTSKR